MGTTYKGIPSSREYRAISSTRNLRAVSSNRLYSAIPSISTPSVLFGASDPAIATTYFSWLPDPGIKNLTTALTVNGSTQEAVFRLEGKDATATTWASTVGSITGNRVGASTTSYNNPCPWNQSEQFVQLQGYDIYRFGDILNLGSDDWVLEAILMPGGTGSTNLVSKYDTNSPFLGYRLYQTASTLIASVRSADAAIVANPAVTVDSAQCWVHIISFFDNSAGLATYLNGGALSASSATVFDRSCSSTGINLDIGGGTGPGAAIAYISMWKASAWLNTYLQPTIARERFNLFAGLVAQTGAGGRHPVSVSRSTNACVPYVRSAAAQESFYNSTPGWIVGTRQLASGSAVSGVPIQPAQANTWTTTFNHGASFGTVRATSFNLSTTQYSPVYNWFANAFIGTAVDNTHGWSYNVVSSTAGVHWFHTWYRPGNKTWIKLESTGSASASCYFNCSDAGTVGTAGGGILTSAIRRYYDQAGNAWYLCYITYNGTAAGHDHYVYICDGDGDDTYTGDAATVNGYGFATGHGIDLTAITSPIPTRAAGISRPNDILTYTGTGNITANAGYAQVTTLLPDISVPALRRTVFSAGSSSNDYLALENSGTDYLTASGVAGGTVQYVLPNTATTTPITYVSDIEWSANRFAHTVNGTPATGSPDTSGSVSSAYEIMNMGTTIASGVAGACLIQGVVIKDFK